MDGTATVGTSTTVARQDHIHPSDTSRAPSASPTFTGTPTAPTATAGDNSTTLSTTAFVTTAVNAKIYLFPYVFVAADSQTAFTTTGTSLISTPMVFLNGALQAITEAYTVSGLTVTFNTALTANESVVILG
jgi:hypothetical protein